MYNLYIKNGKNKLAPATEKKFQSENEFETYLMETKDIFPGIFILKRQVRAGKDILDMVGVDENNNIVIIENKNVTVTEDIVPQILRYAIWAGTNPDSIKAMWLEAKERPDNIEVDWDNIQVRIIVLAPTIKLSVPKYLEKIDYQVDLIEVKRFIAGDEEIVLLNKLEEELVEAIRVTAKENYNREFYYPYKDKKSVDKFFNVVDEIEEMATKNGWLLQKNLNKSYVSFKMGSSAVLGVWLDKWWNKTCGSFGIYFKIKPDQVKEFKKVCPYEFTYGRSADIKFVDGMEVAKLEKTIKYVYDSFSEK